MNASVSPFIERRDDPRVAAESRARLDAPDAIFPQTGPALIQELSACGLRLRTESQLHPDEALVLKIHGEAVPLHARVVWVREAPPARFGTHRTWVAGCRLQPDSIGRARLPLKVNARSPWASLFGRKALRAVLVIGGIALLVYLYLRLAMLIGGSAKLF